VVTTFKPPGATGSTLGLWDGVSFTSIPGDSIGGAVFHLATWGTKLIATGAFTSNGSVLVPALATFDGAQWGTVVEPWDVRMTGPTLGTVTDMRAWGGKLIVAGPFSLIADQDHWVRHVGITSWDGAHWSPLGDGISAQLMRLGEYNG